MWDLFKVAIRNVGRNKRRALITMFTVFIGVTVVTGTRGLLNGLQGEIISSLTRKMHGDLQIHRTGYEDSLEANPYKVLIPFNDEMIQKIKSVPGVEQITPRLKVMGLLNHQKSQSTTPVMISAFTSETELQVCPRLQNALQKGALIDSSQEKSSQSVEDNNLEEAVGLDESQSAQSISSNQATPKSVGSHQLMVTPGLLRGLQAEVGDEVVVLLQDKDNMQQAIVAKITGVVDFALPNAQAKMAWMDFKTLQETLGLQGQTSEIAILADPKVNFESIQSALTQKLGSEFIVQTWLEIGGFFKDVLNLQNLIFNIILVIVFSIVISAIINTSLMTVMERTREIGTLMALGYHRIHIIFLFLVEAATIGLIGGTVALVLISSLMTYLHFHGLDFTLPGQAVSTILYPYVSVRFVVGVFFLSIASALLASFYPAYRASRMRPVQALSSN